ncbi:MrcB family domain-containing protein [Salininema proteolyticum]|uniref:MrcB family domain-containing protein n=1 Tax=Salininema proteolyticum TaxID=1607685 RepID=A0ABV8TTJ6_9ACTN
MIRELFEQVRKADYDYRGSHDQVIFQNLIDLEHRISALISGQYTTGRSRGVGSLPIGLWVAIFHPDVTETATQGIYVVFLFNEDRTEVTLSLIQAVTEAEERAKSMAPSTNDLLRQEAATIREQLYLDTTGLEPAIKLGKGGKLPQYEAASIYGRTWSLDDMPSDSAIAAEIDRFLELYSAAVDVMDDALREGSQQIPPRDPKVRKKEKPRRFKPKNTADYRVHIKAVEQTRSNSHEKLIESLGPWTEARGFDPNTNVHPRDLILHQDNGPDLLVEVKVFPSGRPRLGIRESIGQLAEYHHFLHEPDEDIELVAALSENPGTAYVELLSKLNIAAIWSTGATTWEGSDLARGLGLVD